MLPDVEVIAIAGAIMLVDAPSEKLAVELMVAVLPALIPPVPIVTVCPATELADRVTILPVMALAPVLIFPELAVRVNELAAPALPEERVMVPAAVSRILTVPPVELADSVVALRLFTPVKVMPLLPAASTAAAAVRVPLALIPLAAPASVRVKVDPELLVFNVRVLLAVSVMFTVPEAAEAKVVALVLLMETLPEPLFAVSEAVLSVLVAVTPVLPVREMEVGKL
jgi:hypothetical protein